MNNNSSSNALQKQHGSSQSTTNNNEINRLYPTIAKFTATFHPARIQKFAAHPSRCVTGSAPSLVQLRYAYSGAAHLQWLIAQIATFQEQSSVPNKMTSHEVETLAQNIYAEFYHLKTTEIMLFLAQLLGGKYPIDFHGYLSPAKIILALRNHFVPWRNRILDEHEQILQQQKEKEERLRNPPVSWEEYCRMKGIDKPNPLKSREVIDFPPCSGCVS